MEPGGCSWTSLLLAISVAVSITHALSGRISISTQTVLFTYELCGAGNTITEKNLCGMI